MTFNFSAVSLQFLLDTIIYATEKHADQRRRDSNLPYIVHPMRVLKSLMYQPTFVALIEEERLILAQAAILHDVVEDCDVTVQNIADTFSGRVAALVDELTTPKTVDTSEKKTAYLAKKLGRMAPHALLIKLCDRLDNLDDYLASANVGLPAERGVKYAWATHEILEENREKLKRFPLLAAQIQERVLQLMAFGETK